MFQSCLPFSNKSKHELAKNITLEQGKTLVDAEGDVMRGLRKYSFIHLIKKKYVNKVTK